MVIFSKSKKNTEKKKHGKIVCTKMKLEKDVCGGVYAKKKCWQEKISHTPPQSRKMIIRPSGKSLRVNDFSYVLVVNQLYDWLL